VRIILFIPFIGTSCSVLVHRLRLRVALWNGGVVHIRRGGQAVNARIPSA
jgi:hypothetical protein